MCHMCAYTVIYLKKLFWAQKVCKKNLLSYDNDISYVETKISDRNTPENTQKNTAKEIDIKVPLPKKVKVH